MEHSYYNYKRIYCVIDNNKLDLFLNFEYPILNHCTNDPIENDIIHNITFGKCPICKSIQLINLINPDLLYSYPNKHELTPLWINHHKTFVDFIKTNINIYDKKICEIGGGNNGLFTFLSNIKQYTILDLYEPINKLDTIEYKIGNCESYNNYNEDILILSHTFEHLYNPLEFIKTVKNTKIEHIFISVPNMRAMIELDTNMSVVFSEHTFYFEKEDIIYMFEQNGFICSIIEEFNTHSLFFYLKKSNINIVKDLHIKNFAMNKLETIYQKRLNKVNIEIDNPIYIMPSHYIGQAAYLSIINRSNIIGFLDNDKNKIGQRLYGTPLYIQHPDIIKDIECTILLVNNPYYDEMYKQIQLINPNTNIILF